MVRALTLAVCVCALADVALGDVYMHNPRGSNDRNCERNVNRNNGNRLFDSQNNAKGGYACPRAVGDAVTQDEDGVATFSSTITQNMKIYYYEGSILPIEWTNQHGCGNNSKANCEIVLQYMCEDTADPQVDNFWPFTDTKNNEDNVNTQAFRSDEYIASPRDGIPTNDNDAATDTIPDTLDAAIPDSDGDRRYGMHESYDFYQLCQRTARNRGLYTADQNVRRSDQRGTRQNPNGNRRGLECPEERDYYPWWHPSPWVDIAVLTNDAGETPCSDPDSCETTRCTYYLNNSFNMASKGYCDVDHTTGDVSDKTTSNAWNNRQWYNNREDCEDAGFIWYQKSLSDVIDVGYPTCQLTGFSRVNQLGNAFDATVSKIADEEGAPLGVNANRFMWTIPSIPSVADGEESDYFAGVNSNGIEDAYQSCVLRMRYNLSTSDFPAWPADAMPDDHPWKWKMVNNNNNTNVNDGKNTPLTQDPYIYVGAGDDEDLAEKFVSLAVNTNQYARTFQDRSYKFAIKPRPTAATEADNDADTPYVPIISSSAKIFNVNVRGKRGNIVQTYPAVEYDFIPNSLALEEGDMIHFQWTGSDYNPRRGCNDAEGGPPDPNNFVTSSNQNSRADRNNIIFMNHMAENVPMDYTGYTAYVEGSDDDDNPSGLTWTEKVAAMTTQLTDQVPCDVTNDDTCFDLVTRLAYLNQQSDGGASSLRRGADCLTQAELEAINDNEQQNNHPLNCAKLNAKPYPYFDGGVMTAGTPGMFAFFSSRNNNFSNRDQTGVMCVKGLRDGVYYTCNDDPSTGVLQDVNPALSDQGQRVKLVSNEAESDCIDQASQFGGQANDQGATSCVTSSTNSTLGDETFTTEQAANDALGDGDETSCEEIIFFFNGAGKTVKYVALAVGLAFVGFAAAWLSVCIYNRVKRHREANKDTQFSGHTSWKKQAADPNMI